ncbi:MAG: MFS transporter [Ignavibacteria bacterium]|nr:MFS transporter [Ignavibacteria bacterium]
MAKVLFTVQYEVLPEKRNDFLSSMNELKSLISADGLESYSLFEVKGKNNTFSEVYIFSSADAYEAFDDAENERVNILISKIEGYKVHGSTKYTTLSEM